MIVKTGNEERGWHLFECARVMWQNHPNYAQLENKSDAWKSYDCIVPGPTDEAHGAVIVQLMDKDYTILSAWPVYVMNDGGATIERIVPKK